MNRGGEIFGAVFYQKVSLLANIRCCPNFLDFTSETYSTPSIAQSHHLLFDSEPSELTDED